MSAENGVIEEAEVVEPQSVALIPAAPALSVTPTVSAGQLGERLATIREAMDQQMIRDVDYGVIPGTNKPTLLKPGAEKLGVLFQLDVQLVNKKSYGPGDHLTVESAATVFYAPTGSRVGFGEGLCTSRERKYAYRNAERVCPTCSKPAIIKGKKEYGGGWLCFKKKGGCGAKFADDDQAITGQETGQVENPDLPDVWNTVVKMAEKRARVDAILAVTGASALFTQDAEDLPQAAAEPEAEDRTPVPASGKPLTAEQVGRVVSAIEASDNRVDLVLKAVGVDEPEQLTDVLAQRVSELIS